LFGLHYIKTGVFPEDYGRLYNQLQTMREESDYNCAFNADPEELEDKIEPAREMIETIEKLVNS